jgi:hypothetical protein
MKTIEILKPYKKLKANDVLSVEDSYAASLIKSGIAKDQNSDQIESESKPKGKDKQNK